MAPKPAASHNSRNVAPRTAPPALGKKFQTPARYQSTDPHYAAYLRYCKLMRIRPLSEAEWNAMDQTRNTVLSVYSFQKLRDGWA